MIKETIGGFAGNPAEAFTPPVSSGCCGTASTGTSTAASTCCGTPEAAIAAGACCDPAAKADAVAGDVGCCS